MPKNKKLALQTKLRIGVQTYQIFTNDDEVCIPSLSSILLAVNLIFLRKQNKKCIIYKNLRRERRKNGHFI